MLASYIRQNVRFFVAKVNVREQAKLGFNYLRPLQVAFESPKFMLPIRLGTVNANGPQDLLLYTLTRNGRVETTNYRTVKLPTGMNLPVFVKNEFGQFYKAMFDEQVRKENMRSVFLEYAWGYVLVRPVCCRSAIHVATPGARCVLAGRPPIRPRKSRCAKRFRHPASCSL